MIRSMTLLGSSSGRNSGDAALMSGIMDSVDEILGRKLTYEIPTINTNYVRDNYTNNVKPVSMMPWNGAIKILGYPTYASINRTDLSVIFDAVLFDRSLYNPLFNFLYTFNLLLPSAKKNGRKLGCFNVGLGPVDTKKGAEMLRNVIDLMDFVTVRDAGLLEVIRDIGATNPRVLVTADAALIAGKADENRINQIFRQLDLDPNDEILAVNVNKYIDTWSRPKRPSMGEDAFVQTYIKALNKVVEKLKVPLLFVSTQHHDFEITEKIKAGIKSSHPVRHLSCKIYNHYDVKGALSKVSLLSAMRLHAMILATSELTPTVGLAYQPKCSYYFDSLGLSERMLQFVQFNENALADQIVGGWQERHQIKAVLEKRIPELRAEAYKAAQLVAVLDKGGDIDKAIQELAAQQPAKQKLNG